MSRIPACPVKAHLTLLRHHRSLQGAMELKMEANWRPSFTP